jgi:DNA repair exonuclease SbcCD ATPase subunit
MIKFNKLTLRNFLSYGNDFTSINLQLKDPTLILGINYDSSIDGATDSNGSGKTSILHAIIYSIYDNITEDIDKNNLINNINKKNMETELTFSKHDTYYRITRFRKNAARGGDGVMLEESADGVEFVDKTKSSVAETNKYIESIIGIPFEVFTRIVSISASYEPFLSLPSSHASKANQRDFLENLFGYTEITEKAENLKLKIKDVNERIKIINTVNVEIRNNITNYNTQLASLEQKNVEWINIQADKIDTCKQKLEGLLRIDFDKEKINLEKIEELNKEVTRISNDIKVKEAEVRTAATNNKLHGDWITKHEETIASYESILSSLDMEYLTKQQTLLESITQYVDAEKVLTQDVTKLKRDLESVVSKSKKLDSELAHLIEAKCPFCLQKYEDTTAKIQESELRLSEYNTEINTIETSILQSEKNIKKITALVVV